MKVSKKKYRSISALMISSQVLLFGFLIFWLAKEFQAEKTQLLKELKSEYELVFNEHLDSKILKELVAPSLQDSTSFEFTFSKEDQRISFDDSTDINIVIKNKSLDHLIEKHDTVLLDPDKDQQFRSARFDFISEESLETDTLLSFPGSKDQIMAKSVKMFITHTNDAFEEHSFTELFSNMVDSAQLMSGLSDLSNEKNRKLEFYWKNDSSKQKEITLSVFEENSPTLIIKNYKGYLLKLLAAEIIFAMMLLLISGAALILAWRSLQQQLKLNTLRNDFIANISHELKTPVATMKVALEAIQKFNLKKDVEATDEYLRMASKEVDRLDILLEKVLQHAAIEDSAMILNKEVCNLQELTERVVQMMQPLITKSETELKIVPAVEAMLTEADPVYIQGVIRNLIDNAMKYSGPSAKIEISFVRKNDLLDLMVADNGPGIPEAYIGQVFDKFFRVPTGDKHDVKGYGLGLHLAAQVMKNHGGSISVKNMPEGACIFTLTFLKAKVEN